MRYLETCADCRSLWQAYAAATTAHFEAVNRLEIAKLRHDLEAVAELTPEVQEAVRRRVETRGAFRAHEELVHPKREAATA